MKILYRTYCRIYQAAFIAAGVATENDSHVLGATRYIEAIRALNKRLNIPETLEGINNSDIPLMAAHASKEANPLYPVPILMNKEELQYFYTVVKAEGGNDI